LALGTVSSVQVVPESERITPPELPDVDAVPTASQWPVGEQPTDDTESRVAPGAMVKVAVAQVVAPVRARRTGAVGVVATTTQTEVVGHARETTLAVAGSASTDQLVLVGVSEKIAPTVVVPLRTVPRA
jgi:hypothetical protein